ncbi:unnamed protein product, partial [Tetraodon nigroviridis]
SYLKPLLTHSGPPLTATLPACCGPLARCLTSPQAYENEGQLNDDDSDFILNDTSVGSMYADVTVSTDATGSRTVNRKRSSTASTGGSRWDEGLDQDLSSAEQEVAIRGTAWSCPWTTRRTCPPPSPCPRRRPRRAPSLADTGCEQAASSFFSSFKTQSIFAEVKNPAFSICWSVRFYMKPQTCSRVA